ncbi:ALK and LTK ligand 2b isoform 2-T3 [Clarias gariepinus]|uniref:ALK and LTK ligand 2b isoform X2 n=1 Tax=Clarias gariepinus TaxID=13013 RepID=UPI00234C0879|nr:ALK and LTK ligand 2b isoform X2 [Clarias gariepinus]
MGRFKLCAFEWKLPKSRCLNADVFLFFNSLSIVCALWAFSFRTEVQTPQGYLRFSMSVLRAPVITALALLIMSGGYSRQSGSASARSTSLLQLLTDSGREAAEHQAHSPSPGNTEYSVESREGNEVNKSNQHDQILDVFPRDLRQKEKLIKHLTGPLYFSPKCSKHFYRLYHNTRDCTIPAYYRRCARLLRRLAESQRCSDG